MVTDAEMFDRIVGFVRGVGIPVTVAPVPEGSFLPAVAVVDGGVIVDQASLQWPGDILHEAGHLAVLPADRRGGDVPDDAGLEAAAMAWSYAAALAIGINPAVVFHAGGYKGQSAGLAQNYSLGLYIGLPGLVAAGMAHSPHQPVPAGTPVFPAMVRWLA